MSQAKFRDGDRVKVAVTTSVWSSKRGAYVPKVVEKRATVWGVRDDGDVLLNFTPRGGATYHPASSVTHLRGGAGRGVKRKVTMADVRAANAEFHRSLGHDWSYFDRKTSKFFGGDKFYGPYSGDGGTFFVQANRAGIRVKREVKGEIKAAGNADGYDHVEDARDAAKALAKGTRSAEKNPRRRARR